MKTKFTYSLTFLLIFLFVGQGYSQKRVAIYVQNASSTANVQWGKMTHLVHAFFNPMDNTGNITTAAGVPTGTAAASIWFTTANFTTMRTNAIAGNANIKIIISVGGAPTGSDPNITTRLNAIFASGTARAELVNDLGAFVQNYSLDGVDLDLEHPVSVTEKDNHQLFLQEMKAKLNSLETTLCKDLELSIALNGETDQFVVDPSGADYVNPGVDAYVDFYHLMTYDASHAAHTAINPSWPSNHSPLIHAQESVRDFSNPPFNWSKSKMVIGIPFYGRNGAATQTYAQINVGQTAGVYNADLSGGYNYNGCVTITNKVNFAKSSGLAGVLVWEGSQDLNNSTGYSLASCLYTAMGAPDAWEKTCCDKPNLGNDLLTCNTPFPITLNANTTATGSPTYVWTRILPSVLTINASGGVSQVISSGDGAGTYVVARTSGSCTRRDTIVISAGALPAPALGADRNLCTTPYVLKPSNASSFPPATVFQWQKNGSDLIGETGTTLYGSSPATYTLRATLSGCVTTSDNIVITASSAIPVDACRTTAGTLTLGVTGGTGPFTWYSSDVPGNTVVGTGTTFTTPSLALPSTTYYYVEDAGAITSATVGLNLTPTGFSNDVTHPPVMNSIGMEFEVVNAVKLRSVDVYLGGFGVTFPVYAVFEIINDHGASVYTSSEYTYPAWTGAVQTIPLNTHLPAGKYRLRAVKGPTNFATADLPSFVHHGTFTFPYGTGQDLVITRQNNVAQYGPFFNWQIGDYNACPRIRVRAEVAASCSPVFLPVEMIYFNAEKNGEDVLLEWGTGSEKANDYFAIERSLDGVNFKAIGRVEGNGTQLLRQSYGYIDSNVPNGILYYRLAQYDLDGAVTYSPIKIIDNKSGLDISVAPNPFTNSTSVFVKGVSGLVQLRVFDLQGRVVQSFSKEAGELEIGHDLESGFYIVEVAASTSVARYKIIKE